MGNTVLEISQVEKSFGKHKVLHNVSLKVVKGQVFGFLGPNGAGKTTLIRVILGLIRPDKGIIHIDGFNLQTNFRQAIEHVGAVVETPKFYPHLSAYQNLLLVRNLHRNLPKSRIPEVLEIAGLSARAHDKVGTYSLGMKQRLGIARALLNYPKLVFLDEPMNGLDPQGIIEVRSLIHQLQHQGISLFITSHLLHEVEQVCDQIAIIKNGSILTQGSLTELLRSDLEVVEIYTKDLLETHHALADVAFVHKCTITPSFLLVELDRGSTEQLIRFLVKRNLHLQYLIPRKHSLEEFFMELAYEGSIS